jgi:hypothetical protein
MRGAWDPYQWTTSARPKTFGKYWTIFTPPAIHSTLCSILRSDFAKAIPGCLTLVEHRRAMDGGSLHLMNAPTKNHGYGIPATLRNSAKHGQSSIST